MAKKLVESDFKHNRVGDIYHIDEKQQQKVKKYCREYFEKAVVKHKLYEEKKAQKRKADPDRDKESSREEKKDDKGSEGQPGQRNLDGNRNGDKKDREGELSPSAAGDAAGSDASSAEEDHDGNSKSAEQDDSAKRKRDTPEETEAGNLGRSPLKRRRSMTQTPEESASQTPETLDSMEELGHSGLTTTHQSVGVVQ